ncbi:MAG: DinB family protein [Gemmatimonadota bacterium]
MASEAPASSAPVITPEELLKHWQGHRALTRRVIEAFPEDQLFSFSLGGMRTFGELAWEFIQMSTPTVRGVVTGEWTSPEAEKPATKEEVLRLWDADTAEIDRFWGQISPGRFQETDTAFGQWTMPVYDLLLYVIDNEIHHRGQGYVYLRALGVEPPPFYERG